MPEARLTGRHIVVTGAGTGIAIAIAVRLAAEGAALTLLGRNAERLAPVAEETGGRAAACDIRDQSQVDRALDEAVAAAGPLYAAVANAGSGARTSRARATASKTSSRPTSSAPTGSCARASAACCRAPRRGTS